MKFTIPINQFTGSILQAQFLFIPLLIYILHQINHHLEDQQYDSQNKNDNPTLLMEAAKWWIETHELDHFEKAVKIKQIINK